MLHLTVFDPHSNWIVSRLDVEARQIRIRSALSENGIGGYQEATFQVLRLFGMPAKDLFELNRVIIRDGNDIVFDGRMLEPVRRYVPGEPPVWEVRCQGSGRQFSERLYDRVLIETSTTDERWIRASSALGGDFSTLFQDSGWNLDNDNRLHIGAKQWDFFVNTGCTGGWYYKLPTHQFSEDRIKRVEYAWDMRVTSSSWRGEVRAYDVNNHLLSTVWTASLSDVGSSAGSTWLDLSGSDTKGVLFAFSYTGTTDTYPAADDNYLHIEFKNIRIRTHGTGSNLYQDAVVREILRPTSNSSTEMLGYISQDLNLVYLNNPRDLGLETHRWLDGKRAVDAVADVLKLGDASGSKVYCNVWHSGYGGVSASDNLPVCELATYDLSDWDIEVGLSDVKSIEIEPIDEIYTRAVARYHDEFGRPKWTSIKTATSASYLARRDLEVDVDTTLASQAESVRDLILSTKSSITHRIAIVLHRAPRTKGGTVLKLSKVRAGLRLKLLELVDQPIILIQEAEYDDSTKTVRITPGDLSTKAELQLARLLAKAI